MTTTQDRLPLYVDLDGTLIHSDLLLESFLELIRRNLLLVFLVPFWMLRGKAFLKREIARRVQLRVDLLPYNKPFLAFLREQKQAGRRLILISASDTSLVQAVAGHLDLFDEAIGSDGVVNCSGTRKLATILERDKEFCYAGDDRIDLQVWTGASAAILVDADGALKRDAAALTRIEREFDRPRRGLRPYRRALRLHQWLKNTLVFLPLALAHEINNPELIWQATLAFLAFGLCASSVYVLNDLLDLTSDRQHRSKCRRSFAAGDIPLLSGLLLSPVLLVLAFAVAMPLPRAFIIILALYYFCTGLYSFVLKRMMLVDVIMLAALYTLPNFFGEAPAVQVSSLKTATKVDAATVDTADKKRDEHLKNADFFEVAKFPKITEEGLNDLRARINTIPPQDMSHRVSIILRRYLQEHNALAEDSLIAMLPVSPMKTSAGWALNQRKPRPAPTMAVQTITSSEV